MAVAIADDEDVTSREVEVDDLDYGWLWNSVISSTIDAMSSLVSNREISVVGELIGKLRSNSDPDFLNLKLDGALIDSIMVEGATSTIRRTLHFDEQQHNNNERDSDSDSNSNGHHYPHPHDPLLYNFYDIISAIECNITVRSVTVHRLFLQSCRSVNEIQHLLHAIGKLPKLEYLFLAFPPASTMRVTAIPDSDSSESSLRIVEAISTYILMKARQLTWLVIFNLDLCSRHAIQQLSNSILHHPSLQRISLRDLSIVPTLQKNSASNKSQTQQLLNPFMEALGTLPKLEEVRLFTKNKHTELFDNASCLLMNRTRSLKVLKFKNLAFTASQLKSLCSALLTCSNNDDNYCDDRDEKEGEVSESSISTISCCSSSIEKLHLQLQLDGALNDHYASIIGQMLQADTLLERLYLYSDYDVKENSQAYKIIAESLQQNSTLKTLEMRHNDLSSSSSAKKRQPRPISFFLGRQRQRSLLANKDKKRYHLDRTRNKDMECWKLLLQQNFTIETLYLSHIEKESEWKSARDLYLNYIDRSYVQRQSRNRDQWIKLIAQYATPSKLHNHLDRKRNASSYKQRGKAKRNGFNEDSTLKNLNAIYYYFHSNPLLISTLLVVVPPKSQSSLSPSSRTSRMLAASSLSLRSLFGKQHQQQRSTFYDSQPELNMSPPILTSTPPPTPHDNDKDSSNYLDKDEIVTQSQKKQNKGIGASQTLSFCSKATTPLRTLEMTRPPTGTNAELCLLSTISNIIVFAFSQIKSFQEFYCDPILSSNFQGLATQIVLSDQKSKTFFVTCCLILLFSWISRNAGLDDVCYAKL